jgi:hypothetical protein
MLRDDHSFALSSGLMRVLCNYGKDDEISLGVTQNLGRSRSSHAHFSTAFHGRNQTMRHCLFTDQTSLYCLSGDAGSSSGEQANNMPHALLKMTTSSSTRDERLPKIKQSKSPA